MAIRSEKAIESVPFFPAIAWSIFVMFALFVYLLTSELKNTTAIIEASTYQSTLVDSSPN
jgi:hypothetical protein